MTFSSFGQGLTHLTSRKFNRTNDGVFFIRPGTRIFPVELCCERLNDLRLADDMIRQGKLPFQNWSGIELHMSQRAEQTDSPWFMQSKSVYCICEVLWRYMDRIFNGLQGSNLVFVLLEEFDIQKVGIDVIVGFVMDERELCCVTEYRREDDARWSLPVETVRCAPINDMKNEFEFDVTRWRHNRPEPIMFDPSKWFVNI